ncbi:hypothetical protein [Paracoccus methylarcula]|uniref:hypothetical protein n=1 Tax=Paracoccus methylarcula TaxID=72022 RepID=UPI0011CDA8A4|nr:hypothetical protein [Paracoccus methylarcula]
MQKLLRPLQDVCAAKANITVAFITFEGDQRCSHGMFKGEEFFEENAISDLYEEPGCRPRESSVFDDAYPNDPWAMKSTHDDPWIV